jgi:hypothetical protein
MPLMRPMASGGWIVAMLGFASSPQPMFYRYNTNHAIGPKKIPTANGKNVMRHPKEIFLYKVK